jgi:hypothetical protein
MKTSDRVIALVLVGAVVGGIWWVGARMRERGAEADAGDAEAEASPAATATATAQGVDASPTLDAGADAADAGTESSACRAIDDASKKLLDEARKTRPCTPDPDMSSLGCRSTSKGTWGFRVEDVFETGASSPGDKCGDTGYLVRLVHVDASGAEEAIVPGLTLAAYRPEGPHHAATISTGYRAVRLSDASFFDYDGDGDDEVFVRTTIGTYDRIDQQEGNVFTFHAQVAEGGVPPKGDAGATHIVPYAPAASLVIDTARDVDGDGRPDFLVSLGGGLGGSAPPVGVRLLAHSLPDGTFSMRDAAAVAWAEKQCPADPKLDLSTKTADDFGQKLADDMACALLWGHQNDLGPEVAKACPRTAEAPPPDSGVCPGWVKRLVGTRPAILLR